MIELKPNALYSRTDLAELLRPAGVDVDHFIARLKPRKFLRMLFLGEDLLDAMRRAPALDREEALAPLPSTSNRKRRGPARDKKVGSKLDAYLVTLKADQR